MSRKIRYWSLAGLLSLGVAVAVTTAVAQGPESPRDNSGLSRRGPMWLEGRGSRLGAMVEDLAPSQRDRAGVRVDAVDRDSPAEKAGLKADDVIVEYDGERVRSARQFTRLVQETPDGRSVPLAVMRDGSRQDLTATPEARTFSWDMDIDGDRIRRDVERGLQGLRDFRMEAPPMSFHFEGGGLPVFSAGRRLGVSVDTLSDQLADYFGAAEGGVLVTSVEDDSAAEKAGLKAGDVITSMNGDRVRDARQLSEAVREATSGEVTIGYLREKKAETTKATIERPEAGRSSAGPRRRGVRPVAFTRPA